MNGSGKENGDLEEKVLERGRSKLRLKRIER